jgi:hypothetical protein
VNHYAFHICDAQWGHVIIRFCPHPPFSALVILNGHEWVAAQATAGGIAFRKEANCFTEVSDAAGLGQIAESYWSASAVKDFWIRQMVTALGPVPSQDDCGDKSGSSCHRPSAHGRVWNYGDRVVPGRCLCEVRGHYRDTYGCRPAPRYPQGIRTVPDTEQ